MKELQEKVAKFADARNWANTYQVYGIMLNMIEEVGEGWDVVKNLEKDEELLKKVIKDNNAELEDFIGDIMFLTLKLSHVLNVDAEKALNDRFVEFEKRFPADFMKKNTFSGNKRAGGIDNKYPEKNK